MEEVLLPRGRFWRLSWLPLQGCRKFYIPWKLSWGLRTLCRLSRVLLLEWGRLTSLGSSPTDCKEAHIWVAAEDLR